MPLLSADAVASGVVLPQEDVARKKKAIVVAPRLLKRLQMCGGILSSDAMVAQRGLSVQAMDDGGDACWSAKENQPTWCDDLTLLFSLIVIAVATGCSPSALDVCATA